MKKVLLLVLATAMAAHARPNLSREDALELLRQNRPLRTPVKPQTGALLSLSLERFTAHEVLKSPEQWTAGKQASLEMELPRALWGKTFRLQVEGQLQGSYQAFFCGPGGGLIREAGACASPERATLSQESTFACPPGGCRLRLEFTPGTRFKLQPLRCQIRA